MIAKLHGVVESIGAGSAVIDVGGVGYLLYCSSKTLSQLSGVGEPATFFVITHVREDHIHLYGFDKSIEKNTFELLMTVQGVGTKVALAILSMLSPNDVVEAVLSSDAVQFSTVSGVGPKLADRLVRELKDKIDKLDVLEVFGAPVSEKPEHVSSEGSAESHFEDALSALINLGYNRSEAYTAVKKSLNNDIAKSELSTLIANALRELSANVR